MLPNRIDCLCNTISQFYGDKNDAQENHVQHLPAAHFWLPYVGPQFWATATTAKADAMRIEKRIFVVVVFWGGFKGCNNKNRIRDYVKYKQRSSKKAAGSV